MDSPREFPCMEVTRPTPTPRSFLLSSISNGGSYLGSAPERAFSPFSVGMGQAVPFPLRPAAPFFSNFPPQIKAVSLILISSPSLFLRKEASKAPTSKTTPAGSHSDSSLTYPPSRFLGASVFLPGSYFESPHLPALLFWLVPLVFFLGPGL